MSGPSLKLFGALLALAGLSAPLVAASSVDISLKASFAAPPLLLELLETAAAENSTSYFPLLEKIGNGHFSAEKTAEGIYTSFVKLVQEDSHITDKSALATFDLGLAIHSTAPRVEAHYQIYNSSVLSALGDDAGCESWVWWNREQVCDPSKLDAYSEGIDELEAISTLPIDHVSDPASSLPRAIAYVDIISPTFGEFYKKAGIAAKDAGANLVIRYKPSTGLPMSPLFVSGYGVELALKKTDYIVIDDREDEQASPKGSSQIVLKDEDISDIKPLSKADMLELSTKAASFIMGSENPFDTLASLVQDFPKHSAAIAQYEVNEAMMKEHRQNREVYLVSGFDYFWINGVKLDSHLVNIYSLLDHLRFERKLISSAERFGLSRNESITLFENEGVLSSKMSNEPIRYDYRDTIEGGKVIVWLNDLEKDEIYSEWPKDVGALLKRAYPQLFPLVAKDVHNVVFTVDLSNADDIEFILEQAWAYATKKVPMRFGIVPLVNDELSAQHAKVLYYLLERFNLETAMKYLGNAAELKPPTAPKAAHLATAVKDAVVHEGKDALSLAEILKSEEIQDLVDKASKWAERLDIDPKQPPIFMNGVTALRTNSWVQSMVQRLAMDLETLKSLIVTKKITDDSYIPSMYLNGSATQRSTIITPEDENDIKLINIDEIARTHETVWESLPMLEADEDSDRALWSQLVVVGDFDREDGYLLLDGVEEASRTIETNDLILLHNPHPATEKKRFSKQLYALQHSNYLTELSKLAELVQDAPPPSIKKLSDQSEMEFSADEKPDAFWKSAQALREDLGFAPGERGLVLSGRVIKVPSDVKFGVQAVKQFIQYEHKKRIIPATTALQELSILERLESPAAVAKLTYYVSSSHISNVPEGIFDVSPNYRDPKYQDWLDEQTAIKIGDKESAIFYIVVSINPTDETAQQWVPLLKTLSEMEGVYMRIFLNPVDHVTELPIKRFYRNVVDSKLRFNSDGSLLAPKAVFSGLPSQALLTAGLDTPASWLVAPKDSVHDLDNIKLSNLKDTNTPITAVYELEHILIEGHSRDVSSGGAAPRGAQLVLGTPQNEHFADTIIMANLGYFQFKANPGSWSVSLLKGRSDDIFKIDSVGALGYAPMQNDNSSVIILDSFQGKTLFPRFSRKPGQETTDVLDEGAAANLQKKGLKLASQVLAGVGLTKKVTSQADINIFSVASGHLYERMLNIMMVSVMKHTNKSVKFWFIEQFLSPDFKDFIPHLAAQYGFEYEMVTFAWPHWLRGQKEKQRKIWGYKILFLDVLFPLNLDKVIFVDADQIVRTDMYELVTHDLKGAPYGFTPMCDSRTEMEGFRFWKQGYWKSFLRGLPYHISALYVVDLAKFRSIAAGDRLRQQYHQLSADPNSLSNLDQDLPNHMQAGGIPIHSLPQEWLWCETWCDDDSLKKARTIDLCNNPLTKEPKLDRARRQVPEWNEYDAEIGKLRKEVLGSSKASGAGVAGDDVVKGEETSPAESKGHEDL